ncbi:MAG: hypothetical protein WAU32_05910 [Thermoanaerobaculia bacterium]
MKNMRLPLLLALTVTACVSLTPGGAKVKVYETDQPASDTSARLPQGCRLLATDGPLDQQAPERLVDDPYRVQRNATAGKGGNVLLLRSRVLKSLPKTECPPSDHSVDCQQTLGTWYRVDFESYACDEPALQALAAADAETLPGKVAWWWPFESKKTKASAPTASQAPAPVAAAASAGLTAAELKGKILELMRENVSSDVIVAFVKSRRVAAPLSAEEIIEWKKSGIAEPVIEAAVSQATR